MISRRGFVGLLAGAAVASRFIPKSALNWRTDYASVAAAIAWLDETANQQLLNDYWGLPGSASCTGKRSQVA